MHWVQASRPLAQANIAIPVLWGHAVASLAGALDPMRLLHAIVWGIECHLVIVFTNDYMDRHSDVPERTFLSGGSGVVVEDKIRPAALKRAAIVVFVAWGVHSVGLGLLAGIVPAAAWAAAGLLIGLYDLPPARLSHRGGGEWIQAAGVGIVLPLCSFALQRGRLDSFPWVLLFGTFMLGWASHLATALPDVVVDRLAGKQTVAVRLDERNTALAASGAVPCASAVAVIGLPEPGWFGVVLVLLGMVPLIEWVAAGRGRVDDADDDSFGRNRAAIVCAGSATVVWLLWTVSLYAAG